MGHHIDTCSPSYQKHAKVRVEVVSPLPLGGQLFVYQTSFTSAPSPLVSTCFSDVRP